MSGPLAGRSVVVTRPRSRAQGWIEGFSDAGASVVALPVLEVMPLAREEAARATAAVLRFAATGSPWLALTSVPAVEHLALLLAEAGSERILGACRIACVGPGTRRALEHLGLRVALEADPATGAGLAAGILAREESPRVLHATAEQGLATLARAIELGGGTAERVALYRQVVVPELAATLAALLATPARPIDLLTFASPSAAVALLAAAPETCVASLTRIPALAIGATTRTTLVRLGFTSVTVASSPRWEDVLAAALQAVRPPAPPLE